MGDDNSIKIGANNLGINTTGDRNIIIQLSFFSKEIKINKKVISIVLILLFIIIISWYFIGNSKTDKKELTIMKQQLRGKVIDMQGMPISGIKIILPNGENVESNISGKYIFYDVLANEDNIIKVRFQYNISEYINPDEENNNNQQPGLEYNLVQLRRLD